MYTEIVEIFLSVTTGDYRETKVSGSSGRRFQMFGHIDLLPTINTHAWAQLKQSHGAARASAYPACELEGHPALAFQMWRLHTSVG